MTMKRKPNGRGDILKGREEIEKLYNPKTQDKELEKRIKEHQKEKQKWDHERQDLK